MTATARSSSFECCCSPWPGGGSTLYAPSCVHMQTTCTHAVTTCSAFAVVPECTSVQPEREGAIWALASKLRTSVTTPTLISCRALSQQHTNLLKCSFQGHSGSACYCPGLLLAGLRLLSSCRPTGTAAVRVRGHLAIDHNVRKWLAAAVQSQPGKPAPRPQPRAAPPCAKASARLTSCYLCCCGLCWPAWR